MRATIERAAQAKRPASELRPVSDIITDLATDPETPPHVAQALRGEPYHYHPDCPCGRCMRTYLESQKPTKDAA